MSLTNDPSSAGSDAEQAAREFALHEERLRRMEAALRECESEASRDVGLAFRIRFRDRGRWPRFAELAEACARQRLEFAQLEHRFYRPPESLSKEGRQVFARLVEKAGMEARLEEFSDRLEACEDLYEGATNRVADHRWYLGGHGLEAAIILILILEAVLMAAEVHLRSGR